MLRTLPYIAFRVCCTQRPKRRRESCMSVMLKYEHSSNLNLEALHSWKCRQEKFLQQVEIRARIFEWQVITVGSQPLSKTDSSHVGKDAADLDAGSSSRPHHEALSVTCLRTLFARECRLFFRAIHCDCVISVSGAMTVQARIIC